MEKATPADFNPSAKPYGSKPSASVMTQTTEAINSMGESGAIAEFEQGIYWVDGTVSPNGGSTTQQRRQVYFNNTEIRAGGNIDNYATVRSEEGDDLAGLNDNSDNLPTGETTPVLFDVTNSNYSCYLGMLTINGNNMDLACIAASNRHRQNGAGGIGSVWDSVWLKGGGWGQFGTPRYGQQRQFYAGAFVGNIWKRMRITDCHIPLLLASNTGDDQFYGELNVINPVGGRSYMFAVNVNLGSSYFGGDSDNDIGLDIQKASLNCGSFYAEGDFDVPIVARNMSMLHIMVKYGAGSVTTFKERAFIRSEGQFGAGIIHVDPTTAGSKDVQGIVAMKPVSGSKRNYMVIAPFSESEVMPYKVLGELSGTDKLCSFFSEGYKEW